MDLCKRLSTVSGLNQYIELTQDLERYNDVPISLNMSTILSVKKQRCLEIEYFNKCDGTGAAFKLFERMLSSPASKTWGLLGSEVVNLLQYWLEAVRKHLMSHHIHWWTFLKHLLGFIKIIRRKDASMSNSLVEGTAELMLDLACSGKMEVDQRYETLHIFNMVCADSSREVRMALKNQLEPYFIRLATMMGTCAHLPSQLAALEALLRWLQPRRSALARRAAADKWLLPHLYAQATIDIFLERNWMNFFQDARDFLNCHNETKDLVTSVICRKLSIGSMVLLTGEERRETWLDINSANKSLSMILEPQLLEALGHRADNSCEALLVPADCVRVASLSRENEEIKIKLSMLEPPKIMPSDPNILEKREYEVIVVISSRSNLARVNHALRAAFDGRYQNSLDLESVPCLSPVRAAAVQRRNSIDDQSRFSHPVKEKPKKLRSGYVAWRRFTTLKSPSTASTASLAQLHDKLANLPYYEFSKEPVSVCVQPELSIVNEVNESEISNSIGSSSTLVLRRCAVKTFRDHVEDRKSQSDNETARNKNITISTNNHDQTSEQDLKESQSDNEFVKNSTKGNEKGISSLFAATIGSAEDSIINATLERLPRDKELNTDNLIELLVQEALHAKSKDDKIVDSGINTGDAKKTQGYDSETIEDTQYVGLKDTRSKTPLQARPENDEPKTPKNCIVVSKSTSDESNTEAINETPINYVNVRKRNVRKKPIKSNDVEKVAEEEKENSFDEQAVENFFSQHFAENKMGEVIISPTLAKKINETSSETTDDDYLLQNIDDDFNIQNENLTDLEVVECINDVVDQVTLNTEPVEANRNYTVDQPVEENVNVAKDTNKDILAQEPGVSNDESKNKENQKPKKTRGKGKAIIKSKIGQKRQKPVPKKGKLKLEPVSKMSTIIEVNESDSKTSNSDRKTSTDEKQPPFVRRRRKLYSPKVEQILKDVNSEEPVPEFPLDNEENNKQPAPGETHDEDDIALAQIKKDKPVTPKSAVGCYKELEEERQRYRIRAKRSKKATTPPSPKTRKANDMFENLKSKIENNEKIILIDKKSDKDVAIFNFTSDSEDEEFKQKKVEIQKRTSTTTIGSGTSIMSTRRGKKKTKYTDDSKGSPKVTDVKPKRKRLTKRKNKKANTDVVVIDEPKDLIDERMRDVPTPDVLNTSFTIEKPIENIINQPEPEILAPEIEMIEEENANLDIDDSKKKDSVVVKKPIKSEKKPVKSDKKRTKRKADRDKLEVQEESNDKKDDDRTVSPLPGLIIEAEKAKTDIEESLNTNLIQKIQKIYKNGPTANDTTNTQNLLSDNEKPNCSPQTNITEELGITKDDNEEEGLHNIGDEIDNSNFEENISDLVTIQSGQSSKVSGTNSAKNKRHKLRLNRTKNNSIIKDPSSDKDGSKETKQSNKEAISPIKDVNQKRETLVNKNNGDKNQEVPNSQKSKKSIKSNIEPVNCDEIISIHSEVMTRSKSKQQSKSQSRSPERINLIGTIDTNETEIKSEKSIPTGSINGHGDNEELPPSPEHLKEKLLPRELDDMDDYIKEYFVDLNNQVNISKDSSKTQPSVNQADDKPVKNTKKPVTKDTNDNVRNTSEETERVNPLKFLLDRQYDIANMLPSRRESESETSFQSTKGQNPTVSITRLSSKEIAKYVSSSDNTLQSSFVKRKPIIRTNKSLKPSRESPRIAKNRKSQISPIKLDDFLPKSMKLNNDTLDSKEETQNSQSLAVETTEDDVHRIRSSPKRARCFPRPTHASSPISDSEQSTPKAPAKRKSPIVNLVENKRRKEIQEHRIETINVSLSTQSSNVDDWLRKISNISRVNDYTQASQDALENLMEKLDTTLVEIHQNTTKDFISLFVEAQKQLLEMKEARRQMYRDTAVTVMTEVTKLLDQHFSELDQRAEEREDAFMKWLRSRAGETLRRDCRQKKALVVLLRDDVSAVVHRTRKHEEDD